MPEPIDDDDNLVNLEQAKRNKLNFGTGGAPSAKPKEDLFGGALDDKAKKAKDDKYERILDQYFTQLNLVLSGGSYSDFMDSDEIIKMGQIKYCINTSSHIRVSALSSLFDKVVTFMRHTWNANEIEKWLKAINDAVSELRFKNNMSALTCPTDKWYDRDSVGKLKPPILNSIVAIRLLLEQRKFTLRYDIWKSYDVIMDESGKEQYVSMQTDSIIREWRNSIYGLKGTMYSMEVMKDAYHQIAKDNEFHSLQERIKSIKWDGVDRYASGAQAFGLETNDFTVRVLKQHLMASVARLFYPGIWYDLVLCVFGDQGSGKTTGLRLLYGSDNVISCNFFELDQKRQSEATRLGIWAVENPDTFGDARKADFNRIKADVSTDSFNGRDAYGRMEDTRRRHHTYVIWYTGNDRKVLRDPTGNRRFIIVYSIGPIDEDWLRLSSDQLWAQAYADMEQLRSSYLEAQRGKGIKEDYPKYLELPHDLWEEAKKRQDASMVESANWEDWVPDIIFQDFIVWPSKDSGRKSIHFLTRDALNWLHEKCPRNTSISTQSLAIAIEKHLVLEKHKYDGRCDDIKWVGAQIKRNHSNLRGYRIDFEGVGKLEAFKIILETVTKENVDPTESYVRDNLPQ